MDNLTQFTFKSGIIADFKNSKLKDVDSVAVGNYSACKELTGNSEVKEFINVVALGEGNPAHPDPYTTIILTEEWANSFVSAIKESPKPLFIEGHADAAVGYKMRAVPDGYLTGGMVIGSTLYLRNTLVMEGTEDKKELIKQTVKEINAGMLSTSTSDYLKYETKTDEDDNVTYFAVESVKGQSNAIVEADMTGSDASIIITSFKADNDSSGENKRGEKQMGEKTMTNTELFTSLRNQLDSGRLALSTVAESLGIELMGAKDKVALKRLSETEAKVGSIDEFVERILVERESSFTSLKAAKLKETFVTPELLEIAEPMFSLKSGDVEDIDKEVSRIAELKVFKAIQGKLALSMNYNPDTAHKEDRAASGEVMEG